MVVKPPKMPMWQIIMFVVGMLITGTLNTLCTKIQFTMDGVGLDGKQHPFKKPWCGTFNMLLAMLCVLPIDYLLRRKDNAAMIAPLIDGSPNQQLQPERMSYTSKVLVVSIPAAFDLLATALSCMGILFIPASVWQMLRGACIIFTAVLNVAFLGRKMYNFHLFGLACCILGVAIVGTANILGGASNGSGTDQSGMMVVGMLLVIAAQVVQASQVIAEEYLMKGVDLPAMQVVGLEGLWGTLIMLVIVYPLLYILPGSDNGHQEDAFDTMAMLKSSAPLQGMVLLYLFSCGTFNVTGIMVTQALSAVHRMMLDASRTTIIWAFGLVVYQIDPSSKFGEAWTPYSWLQLGGFIVLVFGQSIYGEVLKLPGRFEYPPPSVQNQWSSPGAVLKIGSPLPAATCDATVVDVIDIP